MPDQPPPLVGRDGELKRLRQAVRDAAAGAGQGVLLTGEPGIGKTALLAELHAGAAAAGFVVLTGRAHESEGGLGYGPVIEAFGPDLGNLGARRAAAAVQGLPQLGRLFAGVPGRAAPVGDPAVERLRLVDGLARLCERVTASTPLLLSVDDLHWADGATLELVHHLLRRLQGDRFLLAATARSEADGSPRGREYLAFRASAARLGLLDELTLAPLAPSDVAALLAHWLPGGAPGDELVAEVSRRSGGLPLIVGVLARHLADTGELELVDGVWRPIAQPVPAGGPRQSVPVPPALRAVLSDRLAGLGDADRDVFDLLAVHAVPLPHATLLAASGRTEPELLDALSRLIAARVVVEDASTGVVGYATSHALLADAATAALPAISRQRLHAALADALESRLDRPDAQPLGAVARHLLAAGGLVSDARVVPALLAAADEAELRGDHAGAAAMLGESLSRLRGGAEVGGGLAERHAAALHRAGRTAEAAAAWSESLHAALAGDEPDRGRIAYLHRQLAAAERDLGRLDEAAGQLAKAADAARPPTDPGGAAFLASTLGDVVALAERREDITGAETAEAELELVAARFPEPPVVLAAELSRAGLERSRGNTGAAAAAAGNALAVARRTGSPMLELRALAAVLEVAMEAGDAAVIRAHADAALTLARRLGVPAFELRALGSRAAAGIHDADWAAADRDLPRALALSRRFAVPRSEATVLVVRGMLQVFRGDLAAAESTIGEAGRHAALVPEDRHVTGDVALGRGRLALARADHRKILDLIPDMLQPGGRNLAWRLLTAAEGLAAVDRSGEIPAVTTRLAAGTPDAYRQAIVDWTIGLTLAGGGDAAAAADRFAVAAASLAALGRPYWAARARLDWAETADSADVTAELEAALEILDRLGARRDADRARRLLRRLGRRPRPARRPGVAGGPLSARELEVARLFAEGMTTAEVAGRLVLSPHTVTAHLRRIYERLGVHSRAALTRVLGERGLLG